MNEIVASFSAFFVQLGIFGLFALAVLDSSFLVMPVAKDLLLVGLAAQHPERAPLYVFASALGSVVGVLLLDLIIRKGGEKGLSKMMKPRAIARVKKKVESRAAIMLVTACIAPPPFPFTTAIAGASALQYPRRRLLLIVFASRIVRYVILAWMAIWWGEGVLRLMNSPEFAWFISALSALCIVASALSVIEWIRRARKR